MAEPRTRLFAPAKRPRVFGLAPGQDFPADLVAGLRARLLDQPPEAIARVTIYVNSSRMMRRIEAQFHQGVPGFVPHIKLLTEAGRDRFATEPAPRSKLARQLELTRFVRALIDASPDLAAPSAAFDLAGGLGALFDEAQIEGVPFETILNLDVTDASGHWQRSLAFLNILHGIQARDSTSDFAARQRRTVTALIRDWQTAPPLEPVLIAGSTGSRGTTHLLMQAVARLPQGAVVLPGFDADLPDEIWTQLVGELPQFDHPQYRFAALLNDLDLASDAVSPWVPDRGAPDPRRARLISMAMRPAPVTDGWLRDGPSLGDLRTPTEALTLIEAADPRAEANAIAVLLREAVENGQTAALISPDRMLTRRVAAALDRWRIEPDDSAGVPLGQTPIGRLIRHLADLFGRQLTAEALVVLVKNPRVALGGKRGPHLRYTRELELKLRRQGPAFPNAAGLVAWAQKQDDPEAVAWAEWLGDCLSGLEHRSTAPLSDHIDTLLERLQHLVIGPWGGPDVDIWDGDDGASARRELTALVDAAPHAGEVDPVTFVAILRGVLQAEVRDATMPHPDVMFLGTQEARGQAADVVILGGLNDGVWPKQPDPDPWLNRQMRLAAGLVPPDQQIGLSAHDFQQVACAPKVILARAKRDADADAVPSRWLNRLTNLLDGLTDQHGPTALAAMRARGQVYLDLAATLDVPTETVPPAPRPSPAPPTAARPRKLSVTEVELFLRDPYQIYARHVLRLRALDPLRHKPDAAERGSILHMVLEHALPGFAGLPPDAQRAHLLTTAEQVLDAEVQWPTARRFWLARLARVADHFITEETERAKRGTLLDVEEGAGLLLPSCGMTLTAKTDRMDRTPEGLVWIYDYKTGTPPTPAQQKKFNKQLHITAFLAESGGFSRLGPLLVAGAEYIGLGSTPKTVAADFDAVPLDTVQDSLHTLFTKYLNPEQGYTAQVARETMGDYSDYDQLSRGGEWDTTQEAVTIKVGDHL